VAIPKEENKKAIKIPVKKVKHAKQYEIVSTSLTSDQTKLLKKLVTKMKENVNYTVKLADDFCIGN